MIPKIIHYCWFGKKEKPNLVKKCVNSWRENCSDYKIIEWNEDNFDINSNSYVKEAYQSKKWAFVSDYVRLYAIVNYGGIYVDTDLEILKPLDMFLNCHAFTGFEAKDSPITAIMGCEKGYHLFKELLHGYDNRHFIVDGNMDTTTNTAVITKTFIEHGIKPNGKRQTIEQCVIYPQVVFCPNSFINIFKKYSKKTFTVHHFMGSWTSKKVEERNLYARVRMFAVRRLRDLIGTKRLVAMKK